MTSALKQHCIEISCSLETKYTFRFLKAKFSFFSDLPLLCFHLNEYQLYCLLNAALLTLFVCNNSRLYITTMSQKFDTI